MKIIGTVSLRYRFTIDVIYGDPAKAKAKLGWEYRLTFEELIQQLVEDELASSGGALLR